MRREASGSSLRRRMLFTVTPAVVGALFGYLYGRFTLSPEALDRMVGMYSAAGAAAGILVVRMAAIFKAMFSDYFKGE